MLFVGGGGGVKVFRVECCFCSREILRRREGVEFRFSVYWFRYCVDEERFWLVWSVVVEGYLGRNFVFRFFNI